MKVPALHWETTQLHAELMMQTLHDEFTYEHAGLFINPAFPHLEASPDGLISCRMLWRRFGRN